jgi:iron complex transport system ATP-binding protein
VSTTTQLDFDSVAVSLSGQAVLRDVSFSVATGEVVGLLGRNGAGKTTLLRLATRTLAPDAGRITLAGEPLTELSRRALAQRVATVPQELHVPFPFLASEIVLMGRAPHQGLLGFESASDLARAQQAMEEVGIGELADRPLGVLSGGERQLVMFARALVQDPEILLLDEPTSHLDLRHRIDVLRIVRRLARRGRGALVVSHDLSLAARTCDRIVVLGEGRVLADGEPGAVLSPALLHEAFGIDADIVSAPDGAPLVVPRMSE